MCTEEEVCFLRTSTNPVYKGRRILGLSRHISESSINYKKSTKDDQKLILLLAFSAVKFERSPGAD